MRTLIFGGTGMLGHRLAIDLRKAHDVTATVQDTDPGLVKISHILPIKIIPGIDVRSCDIADLLSRVSPDVVINCTGILHHHKEAIRDPASMLSVNATFPGVLATACARMKIRVIHFSTDCVFSGVRGGYSEADIPDARDLYGQTKRIGEIEGRHLTLRTSFVGREIRHHYNLLEWFLRQNQPIPGYTDAYFSGVTTNEISKILLKFVLPNDGLKGLYHIAGPRISKNDLLLLVRDVFKKNVEIVADGQLRIDRSLNGSRFERATGYQSPDWRTMLEQVKHQDAIIEEV
jgi:dTDP-4-dehydrorhamnose reductase